MKFSALLDPCIYELTLIASSHEFGLSSKIAVQVVNRASDESDEDIILIDKNAKIKWSVRNDLIQFPILSLSNKLQLKYTRTYGKPSVIILVLFLDAQEYLDRFVHIYQSEMIENQYAISSVHYSNWTSENGDYLNRWAIEKLWFQKVNLTDNSKAILWIHSPQFIAYDQIPIAKISYHIDNCSIVNNSGLVIVSHQDLYRSANIFQWNFWSNTFAKNYDSSIAVHLLYPVDLWTSQTHSFKVFLVSILYCSV
ncbi:unnamed protein product [Thelazia callipaeda]|uniref:Neur_chan_LBD domain-containing protein n=1 Tax=Thelazia callipaeda TaxID=103827 RepID=A0A0N5CSY9_THECL|nr:unnamed protein product [Thelazia callipaeda]